MRTLAIGDIHGCFRSLVTLEKLVPFESGDRIITLGDYVDRGPDSRAVLDWIITNRAKYNLVAIRGNHELMMYAAAASPRHYSEWIAAGGEKTLASYSKRADLDDVPQSHWDFLKHDCRPYFETKTHFFVHANAHPDMPLSDQPDYMLYWEFLGKTAPHVSGKIMVCGHTPQREGVPLNDGHAVCLDTWAHATGWLTCLDVDTGCYWQANEASQTRRDKI